jgi:ubiquinone/menaquinone biosynthesis C-methylase UbiE
MAEIRYQLKGNAPQRYEQNNVPRLLRPQAEAMFDQVSLHEGDRVLDVACGTGIVTRVAVERYHNPASIVGLDFNAGMLEVAQAHTPRTDTPIAWQQGDMCALPFPDDSFDIVLCQQGLQFAPDKLTALCHMRRVLAPGGRLAFTVWSEVHPLIAATVEAVRRHVNDAAATDLLSAFDWADTDIRKVVDEAGFRAIEMHVIESPMRWPSSIDEVAEFIAHSAARSQFTNDIESAITVMAEEVRVALQPYRENDDFVMPARSYLVQARAE